MSLEIKQLLDVDENILNIITTWIYERWGEKENYTFEEIKCFMKHSMQKDRLPQTYGLFLDNRIIGMYQFTYEDLDVRPDIYPWLANVYIAKEYRKKGYGKNLLLNIKEKAKEKTPFKEIFLYTKYTGFYEKFGWTFVSEIDTYKEIPRVQRLYKLKLK